MGFITAAIGVGWVVSPVISLVINKIASHIEKKYFKNSETGKYLKEMQTSLQEIHVIMVRVEKQRIENHEQLQLVQGIKDAIYEAEDVMNEFEYNLLDVEKSVEQQKLDTAASGSSCTHVALSVYDTFTEKRKELRKELSEYLDWPILGDKEFKKKVKEVSESLVRAKDSSKILYNSMKIDTFTNIQFPEQENELPTSSEISDKIVGRKEEREKIIELLFEKNKITPTIIQIEGPGGIGKTTLARLVYHDPRITESKEQDSFELKMWLSVSENFDSVKLTKEMLSYVSPDFSPSNTNFNLLQKELKEKLTSKRILLVLDNVWYVKDVNKKSSFEQNWLQFLAPLEKTKTGSKIIVTTREGAVDTTLESFGSLEVITLGGLNDANSWSLLQLKAFGRKNQHNRHILEPIGQELIKNLKGFPLAIRVVGTELRGKSDTEEWKRILNDNAILDKSDIMDILLRSYEHLPNYLQPCFAYCSLFPKGYYLKQDRLVHMWIAQGFVHPRKQKSPVEIGNSYFNELIDRSFIQLIKRGKKEYYMMHDLMNDLACHVSQGECYKLKEGDTLENLGSVRHLSVTAGEHAQLVNIRGLDKLRTFILLSSFDGPLIFLSYPNEVDVAEEIFIKMKKIRVLDINCNLDKLPNIGECKLLHYLCFRNGRFNLAPDTFSKIRLLTVLFIRKGRSFDLALPQSICCMSRLEFINTSKSIKMDLSGRVQLHSVWRGGHAVFNVKKKQGWELDHLRDFNNIKDSLVIGGLQNVASREKTIEAQLGSKKYVTELRLSWDRGSREVKSNIVHNEILEALRPHPNIETLEICNYPGDELPSWLESNWLSRLTYLRLDGYNSGFKMLPALGQFSQLKRLRLAHITTVSRIGDEFCGNGIFSSLEELQFFSVVGLEEWSSPCGVGSFPKLRYVELNTCPNLFSLPEMESFSSLRSIDIWNCPKIRSLPKLPVSLQDLRVKGLHPDLKQFYDNDIFPSLEELYIYDMKDLEEWSSPCGVYSFPKLRKIDLWDCRNLLSLPEMESFYSLESVDIRDCPKIRLLPKLPVSLLSLAVQGLHPDLKQFYGNDIFPSLKELYIANMKGLQEWSSPREVHSFPKLRNVVLYRCPDLFHLSEIESLCSLESIDIRNCPKIRSLPKLPVSLRYIHIKKVHPDLEEQLGNKNGPEWDKVAAVSGCCCHIKRAGTWVVIQYGK
ncbi:Disease resistance protein (CC-NBS-LRR class) family [Rhynchospora pubera]|uniref:Disease resistance protein (CC-NBS-LRR class) family n=1 Tax=Rhynchospora pubera TaxID=906938 RepID=A0AAV8F1Q3_9POAL|nr:Disease resistance protein (CC-NBS-LRR class) family [Rhynchospora pubera]